MLKRYLKKYFTAPRVCLGGNLLCPACLIPGFDLPHSSIAQLLSSALPQHKNSQNMNEVFRCQSVRKHRCDCLSICCVDLVFEKMLSYFLKWLYQCIHQWYMRAVITLPLNLVTVFQVFKKKMFSLSSGCIRLNSLWYYIAFYMILFNVYSCMQYFFNIFKSNSFYLVCFLGHTRWCSGFSWLWAQGSNLG